MGLDTSEAIELSAEAKELLDRIRSAVDPRGPGGKRLTRGEVLGLIAQLGAASAQLARDLAD